MEQELFARAPIPRAYFKMALPVVLSMLVSLVYNMVDTWFIAQTQNTALVAGVSLCAPMFTLMVAMGDIFGLGGSSLISRLLGQGEKQRVRHVSAFCCYGAILWGVLIGAVMLLLRHPILSLLGAKSDTMDSAMAYYCYLALGAPAIIFTLVPSNILRTEGMAVASMVGSITGALVNIVLDPIFIFGLNMGAGGAALATVLSEAFACGLTLLCLTKADGESWQLRLKSLRVSPMQLREMLRLGLPAGLQSILYTVSNMVIQASINSFGTATVASWTVYGKVDFVYWMTVNAMGLSVTTFAGQNFGAKKYDRIKKGTLMGLGILAVLTVIISSIMLLLARPLLGLFTEDKEVMQITLEMMHFLVPTYLTYICVEIFSGAVRGAGDVVAPTLMTCFGVCILRVLWILVAVPLHRTVVMVEWSYPITWSLTSVMYLIYYFHGGWLRRCIEKQSRTYGDTEEAT